jgi:hypothetical protein
MRAVFGEVRAIDDEDTIFLTERLVHQALMLGKPRLIIPTALAHELLQGPYLPLRMRPHP